MYRKQNLTLQLKKYFQIKKNLRKILCKFLWRKIIVFFRIIETL